MSDTLLAALLKQAYLFDDPSAYAAGVQDAWQALVTALAADEADVAA